MYATNFGPLLRPDLQKYGDGGASNLAFNEKVKALQSQGKRIFHFGFGQSPFPLPESFVRHLKDTGSCNDYLNVAGLPELRKAIADFHKTWDQVDLDPEAMVVAPGSKELIYLTMAVFRGIVWLAAPAWTVAGVCYLKAA